jgi:hypothetical protein
MAEERIDEEEIAFAQQWRDAMKRQVHNVIVGTLEASENSQPVLRTIVDL